ncbi:uncharacterized protein LOC132285673 [Cornus florida]|uniref:uncharacterized protein LOC132285673 n=1 Tax=Cornus florida TaxID=4283 RepID=UPI00289A7967|nr:uncharacterized protein LOC132285673 [Cornus florida]
MQPRHQNSRINLAELKAQIIKKLGPEGSMQYFYYLNRLLSLKISKVEFNKLCLQIVGRENIPLHNQFVRSILKNACNAKVPPPIHDKNPVKSARAAANKDPPPDGHQQNGSHPSITQTPNSVVLLNGDILPLSPLKARSAIHDQKLVDRHSPLGPNGKTTFASQQSTTICDSDSNVVLGNGNLISNDIQSLVQHHQEITKQAENAREVMHQLPAKSSEIKTSPDNSVPVHSKDQIEVFVGNEKEVSARSLVCAPLGIPFCPVSIGAAGRVIPLASSGKCPSSFESNSLLKTKTLRERMELIATTQGLEGVSMGCADLLNNGLDAYLKGLIRSCIELAGARSAHEPLPKNILKHRSDGKLVNGVTSVYHYQMQNSGMPLQGIQEQRSHCPISLLDFKTAMELDPKQLGEDWPLLMEKICTHAFEE